MWAEVSCTPPFQTSLKRASHWLQHHVTQYDVTAITWLPDSAKYRLRWHEGGALISYNASVRGLGGVENFNRGGVLKARVRGKVLTPRKAAEITLWMSYNNRKRFFFTLSQRKRWIWWIITPDRRTLMKKGFDIVALLRVLKRTSPHMPGRTAVWTCFSGLKVHYVK